LTSLQRCAAIASIGLPGSESSEVKSQRIASASVKPLPAKQFAVTEQLLDPTNRDSKPLRDLRNGEPLSDVAVVRGVDLCHVGFLSPP